MEQTELETKHIGITEVALSGENVVDYGVIGKREAGLMAEHIRILSREYLVLDIEISAVAPGVDVIPLGVWSLFKAVQAVLSMFSFVRFRAMEFRFQHLVAKTLYGAIVVNVNPWGQLLDPCAAHGTSVIDVASPEDNFVQYPFISRGDWLQMNGAYNAVNSWTNIVRLRVAPAVSDVVDVGAKGRLRVFMSLKDPEVMGPKSMIPLVENQAMRVMDRTATNIPLATLESMGAVGMGATAGVTQAIVSSSASNVFSAGEGIARAASRFMRKFTSGESPKATETKGVQQDTTGSYAPMVYVADSKMLGIRPHCRIISPQLYGDSVMKHSLHNILRNPCYAGSRLMDPETAAWIRCVPSFVGNTALGVTPAFTGKSSWLKYFSGFFDEWSGTLEYLFYVPGSPYVTSTITIFLKVDGPPPTPFTYVAAASQGYSDFLQFRTTFTGTKLFMVKVPFVDIRRSLPIRQGHIFDSGTEYGNTFLGIQHESSLAAGVTSSTVLDVNCFIRAGEDFEFYDPVNMTEVENQCDWYSNPEGKYAIRFPPSIDVVDVDFGARGTSGNVSRETIVNVEELCYRQSGQDGALNPFTAGITLPATLAAVTRASLTENVARCFFYVSGSLKAKIAFAVRTNVNFVPDSVTIAIDPVVLRPPATVPVPAYKVQMDKGVEPTPTSYLPYQNVEYRLRSDTAVINVNADGENFERDYYHQAGLLAVNLTQVDSPVESFTSIAAGRDFQLFVLTHPPHEDSIPRFPSLLPPGSGPKRTR